MIRRIVQHQHHPSGRVNLSQQMFQKMDKSCAVLRLFRCPGNRIFLPVVPTKDVPVLFDAWSGSWNAFLLAALHPASPQRWVQGYRGFVHKDELEIFSEDLFFNASNSLSACALASGSCKWPKSCLGRR